MTLWLLLILGGAAAAQSFESVRASIQRDLTRDAIPSLAVAVARDGKILWEEGFGWADRERRRKATAHSMYSLASISKPITATGLMVLAGQGKVDLDQPVNRYLDPVALRAKVGDAAEATVRRVASHTAGLPLHYQFFYADEPYQPPPMEETIRRYGLLFWAPGERYQYSNLGFGILDYLIHRVSGRAYADFMREAVFLPLGLTHTSVHIGPGLEAHASARYGGDGTPIPFYHFDHPGASAVWSSAHDLVRFGMFHLKAHLDEQRGILTDPAIDEMHRPTATTGPGRGYGVGWATSDVNGYHTVSHTGGMGGVATNLTLVPSEKLAVVALCNSAQQLPHRVVNDILAAMLPKWKQAPPASSPSPRKVDLSGAWTGHLETHQKRIPLEVRFQGDGDIHVRLGGQLWTLLNQAAFSDDWLTGRFMGDTGTEDGSRRPHTIELTLKRRGDVLNGAASAVSLPGRRAGNALTSWVEVRRTK